MIRSAPYEKAGFALLVAAVLWWALIAPGPASAQAQHPTEYQVKAAFLLNFGRFTEWPEGAFTSPDAPLVFGILGRDPFAGQSDAMMARAINGRRVQVRRFQEIPQPGECHVLFIGVQEYGRLETVLDKLGAAGMVLVGDAEPFAARGGMINFIIRNDTVGFAINVDAAARAGLTFNSRLLKIAEIVTGSGE
jgi:hypothetical protein